MALTNAELQKRYRDLTKEVLVWYEAYTRIPIETVRKILKKERKKNEKTVQGKQK